MEFISGKIPNRAVKVVVYGPEGIGKSTFASKFPSPLFIDPEDSTVNMDVTRTKKPSSWTMLLEQVKYVKANPGSWQTLVIDTADWAEALCIAGICAEKKISGIEDMGYGKGYTYLEEEFGRFLNLLSEVVDLGINVVVNAHATMRKFEQPDELGAYDRWELKLEKKTSALLKEWADIVLFANYKTYVVNVDNQGAAKGKNKAQGGKRIMYTTHTPSWDAKNRHGLADELPFDYGEITHIPYARPIASTAELIKQHETKQEKPAEQPATEKQPEILFGVATPVDMFPPLKNELDGVPKALADLMSANDVTTAEIQQIVGVKGYYPANTPIANYDPKFVAGVLVGAWAQVFGAIKANRK